MRLSFVGDVSFTGHFSEYLRSSFNGELFGPSIKNLFASSDFAICNLEGPVTNRSCIENVNLNVKSPLNTIECLKKNKLNVFGLANNHIFDAGIEGFSDTINALEKNDSYFFGAGRNLGAASKILYLKKEKLTIGIIGVGHNVGCVATENSPGIFTYKKQDLLKERIKEAKANADWVVVYCHAGPEFNFYPTPVTRDLMKRIINFGADIVIGHHPHTVQGIEEISENKLIVYSLGNFIFDLSPHKRKKGTDIGLIVSIDFESDSFEINNKIVKINRDLKVIKVADKKYLNRLDRISDFSNYKRKIFMDSFRILFLNPFLVGKSIFTKIISFVIFPFLFLRKIYVVRGYDREYVDIVLNYCGLNFFKKFLRKDDFYKSN